MLEVEVDVVLEVEGVSVLVSFAVELADKSFDRLEIMGVVGMFKVFVGDLMGDEGEH